MGDWSICSVVSDIAPRRAKPKAQLLRKEMYLLGVSNSSSAMNDDIWQMILDWRELRFAAVQCPVSVVWLRNS
ncbi:MAG: hypothetical protein M2R46_04375 [Verrucomicrobia subdivision 3 bacterium]|nr:hypothetical protein [Limisphaerales bacterium]